MTPLRRLLALALLAPAVRGDFAADVAALTRHPHRLAGTPEGHAAADHVVRRLEEIGVDEVVVQPFPMVQTRIVRCEIEVDGRMRPLLPLRPNGIVPPVTPPEGTRGRLLHAGSGALAEYGDRDPRGAIVVLHLHSPEGMLRAFRLGAAAVVFTSDGPPPTPRDVHHVRASANLLRFHYEGPAADLPEGAEAVLHSEIAWTPAMGRNVIGILRSPNPIRMDRREEAVVLAAPLDSFGEVPRRSPHARGAANVAALLGLAEALAGERPDRHVVLAFLDHQARAHEGAGVFYRVFDDGLPAFRPDTRGEQIAAELEFLGRLERAIREDAHDPGIDRERSRRLRAQARTRANEAAWRLYQIRDEARLARTEPDPETERELDAARQRWNELLRALARESGTRREPGRVARAARALVRLDPEPPPGPEAVAPAEYAQVVEDVLRSLALRREELARDQESVEADLHLRRATESPDPADGREATPRRWWPSLHVSLALNEGPTVGVVYGDDAAIRSQRDSAGLYGRVSRVWHEAWQAEPVAEFDAATVDGSLFRNRAAWAGPGLTHSGAVASKFGIYNLALAGLHDPMPREGTPIDTADRLDLGRLAALPDRLAPLLRRVASDPNLSLTQAISPDRTAVVAGFAGGRSTGPQVMARSPGRAVADQPTPGAVLQLVHEEWAFAAGDTASGRRLVPPPQRVAGFDDSSVILANQNGTYTLGPIRRDRIHHPSQFLRAFAAAFDARGEVVYASDLDTFQTPTSRINLFPARGGFMVFPPQLAVRTTSQIQVMDAVNHAPLQRNRSFVETLDGIVHWYAEDKVPGVKLFVRNALAALAGTDDLDAPSLTRVGGLEWNGGWTPPASTRRGALDLWRIDEERLDLLRRRNIINPSLEELHGGAREHIQAAAEVEATAGREAALGQAFLTELPVYRETRRTLDDLVVAVLILLALCVPFAFALERLLVGTPNVYRQIGWFSAFFIATFLLLYTTHPAFAVSRTPIIIFLGFAVVVLAGLVIAIIMRKFETELKALQGMTRTVHAADVSRFATTMAAVSMGIATMRRRPLRTALTAVTIILLTFTILVFASFGRKLGVARIYLGPPAPVPAVQVRQIDWTPVNPAFLDLFPDGAVAAPRVWGMTGSGTDADVLLATADGAAHTGLRGILGLTDAELAARPDLAEAVGRPDTLDGRIWMTPAVASGLGVGPGDRVRLRGQPLEVGGLLDVGALTGLADPDGSSPLPVDFTLMAGVTGQAELEAMQGQDWAAMPYDACAIVSADTAWALGGTLRQILFYPGELGAAEALADDLARLAGVPVTGTRRTGVYTHRLGTLVEASGARDLVIPLVLGGLVVFGTMLGSVADREKEIYTFSALGLAPAHVASLFLAEAMVYSVIGGMSGYLVAQSVTKMLTWLAGYGLVAVPEINYSSTHAIVTLLLVMVAVLLSAIYPAIKASRSANPGLLRVWKLPAPDGDVLRLVFPFTVSQWDLTGLVSFLKEHFDHFTDTGLGRFMTRRSALAREAGDQLGLDADLALAPFDLGVSQALSLRSQPSEIPGIEEVALDLRRLSGQPRDWARLNKMLLDDLRQQFLIWRSLPPQTMQIYRDRTLAALKEGGRLKPES